MNLPADSVLLRTVGTPVVIGNIVWVIGCGEVWYLSHVVTSHRSCDWCNELFGYAVAGPPLMAGFGVGFDWGSLVAMLCRLVQRCDNFHARLQRTCAYKMSGFVYKKTRTVVYRS